MRILLVGPLIEENLSLDYLAAALRAAGHEALIAPFEEMSRAEEVLRAAQDADLVGLSMSFQARAGEFLELARSLKTQRLERPIVAGGHFASCAAEDLLRHEHAVDVVVIHEGERTLVELADAGCGMPERLREIAGIAFRSAEGVVRTRPREALRDLDELPVPDRSGGVKLLGGVPSAYMLGSRGCLQSCAYCCITTLHRLAPGPRLRQRAPEAIASEMAALHHEHGVRHFLFHDDTFLLPSAEANHRRLDELERALAVRGVRDIALTLKLRPSDAEPAVMKRLRALGLIRVFVGVESANEAGLRSLHRQQSVEQSERALALLDELGISAQYTILMFHPEATIETLRSDVAFIRMHAHNPWNFCRAEIYAGTPLEARMIREGRARGDWRGRTWEPSEPSVARAWSAVSRVLRPRFAGGEALLNKAIRLDHLSAVLGRFYRGPAVVDVRKRVAQWRELVASDTLDRLDEILTNAERGEPQPIEHWVAQELASGSALHEGCRALRADIKDLILRAAEAQQAPRRAGLKRAAVAACFAMVLAGCSDAFQQVETSEMAPTPLEDTDGDGLADKCEVETFGTDPAKPDTDGDGVLDGDEDTNGDGTKNRDRQGSHPSWCPPGEDAGTKDAKAD